MSDRQSFRDLLRKHGASSFDRNTFEIIINVSKSFGLSSDNLLMLCSWIESEKTDENDKLKLIECLIPEQDGGIISEDVCIKLAYLLKSSKISLTIKVELLKWMVCAHSFMETGGRFQMLYEIFFSLLKSKEMRPYATHFVSLITEKKHVTFRRVKSLFKFENEFGIMDYSCSPILRTYFLYAPEYFEDELDEGHLFQIESLGAYPSLIKCVHHRYEPNFSNVFLGSIENSSTAVLSEYDAIIEKSSEIPSSRITSFQQLYKQFRALERSNNILKILQSRLSRLFLTSRLNQNIETKVYDYICAMLHEDFDLQDIIEKHLEIFRLKLSFPEMSEFTEFLLLKDDFNPDIAEVMCYEPVSCFKKIEYKLQIIQGKIMGTEDTEIKCRWLNSVSKMFCYWSLQNKKYFPCDGKCGEDFDSDRSSDTPDTPLCHILPTELYLLGSELDSLCDSIIMEDCNPFALNQVLQHYNMLAIVRQLKASFQLRFPSPSVFQLSIFSLIPLILETLCELILRIKAICESTTKSPSNEEFIVFQASCNDIKKVFFGGAYENESTYLAKSETFKRLNERCSEYKNGFIMHKHPAILLTTMKFDDIKHIENVIINPESRHEFCNQLARNGFNYFIRLISKIK